MSHAKNKVEWCLEKAKKELKEKESHRGLVKSQPHKEKAREFINKAEHYLRATAYLKEGNFSDISASTVFYAMYHSLLAIAAKFGYFSRNQECTFALMYSLIEDRKINFEKKILDKIALLNADKTEKASEKTSVEIREQYQYETKTQLQDNLYKELFSLAQQVISKAKVIIEE